MDRCRENTVLPTSAEDEKQGKGAVYVLGLLATADMVGIPDCAASLRTAAADYTWYFKSPKAGAAELRTRCTDAFLTGKGLKDVFPQHNLHQATDRLVEVYLGEELRLGMLAQDCDAALAYDPDRFIDWLTPTLTADERINVKQKMSLLEAEEREVLLRYLNNEPLERIAQVMGTSLADADSKRRRAAAKLRRQHLPFTVLSAAVAPSWPKKRETLFANLGSLLPAIDKECRLLAKRLDQKDRDEIALSLFQSKLSVRAMTCLLAYLNTFSCMRPARGAAVIPETTLIREVQGILSGSYVNVVKKQYEETFDSYSKAFRLRPHVRLIMPEPPPYELSKEAENAIYAALGTFKLEKVKAQNGYDSALPRTLQADEEVELAQQIELGMWAEMRLAMQDPDQYGLVADHMAFYRYNIHAYTYGKATKEELQQCADMGRGAFRAMLYNNIGLAIRFSKAQREVWMNDDLVVTKRLLGGMNGVMRAIRKFDYTKGNKFSTYAAPWIRVCAHDAVYLRDHESGLPAKVLKQHRAIERKRELLFHDLGRPPTDEELASACRLSVTRVKNVLQWVHDAKQHTGQEEVTSQAGILAYKPAPEEEIIAESFGPATIQLFSEAFADDPAKGAILALHVQQGLSEKEIGQKLGIGRQEVVKQLATAKATLAQYLTPRGRRVK